MGRPALNLEGRRFGRLMATNELRVRDCGTGRERLCICDCGQETWIGTSNLSSGHTKSCGCWLTAFKKLDYGMAARNQVLDSYKRGAVQRDLVWELSDEQFDLLTQDLCFYCNREPYRIRRGRRHNGDFVYNGIDRIDSSVGYVNSNVVTCCTVCNRAKSDMSMDDFMVWIGDLCEAFDGKK